MVVEKIEFKGVTYNARHGGPFDRGSADSYYSRGAKPHYYVGGTGTSPIVTEESMTAEEVADYYAGYDHNEQFGDKKSYD
jgi:hypothetical protein